MQHITGLVPLIVQVVEFGNKKTPVLKVLEEAIDRTLYVM